MEDQEMNRCLPVLTAKISLLDKIISLLDKAPQGTTSELPMERRFRVESKLAALSAQAALQCTAISSICEAIHEIHIQAISRSDHRTLSRVTRPHLARPRPECPTTRSAGAEFDRPAENADWKGAAGQEVDG
jgi:hypothetical protein